MAPEGMVGSCANCGKETTKHCLACSEGLDVFGSEVPKTRYCNTECQRRDWLTHNITCKQARNCKQLYRAGQLVRDAFYIYREHAFDLEVIKVEKKGKELHFFEGYYANRKALQPFPSSLFSDEEDKKAVLVWNCCFDALGYMSNFINQLLDSITDNITGLSLIDKGSRCNVLRYLGDGTQDTTKYSHEILKVELKLFGTFAFDVTSAQYGHPEPVTEWTTYERQRVAKVLKSFAASQPAEVLRIRGQEGYGGYQEQVWATHLQIAKAFNYIISGWSEKHKMPLSKLLKLKNSEYETESHGLLKCIDDCLKDYIQSAESRRGIIRTSNPRVVCPAELEKMTNDRWEAAFKVTA